MRKSPFTHPSGESYNKEQLAPYLLQAVQTVKAELPQALSERLTHNRVARNHGSYSDFYLVNMWDRHQTAVLPKDHFTYCLSYWQNRRSQHPEDGELHLWLNKIRLYQNRGAIIDLLDQKLPRAIPEGFTYESTERYYTISHRFWFPEDMELFAGYLVPLYKRLILSVHPILMEVIDEHTGVLDRESIKSLIRERDRIPYPHPGRRSTEDLRAYGRSIATSLRKKLLEKHNYKCANCGCDLRQSGHHIDHIVPFSRGGLTVPENLQPLCPKCNLTKGNR